MKRALVTVLAALLGSFMLTTAVASSLVIGTTPPDFVLPSLQGKNLRLSEYRPDVVVLNFWAAWCKRCGDALPALDALYQQQGVNGLQVLAVGVDYAHPQTAEFIGNLQTTFPILADDAANSVSKAYELGTLPLTLVIDREGRVQFIHTGFDEETGQQLAAQVTALLAE